MRPILFNKNEQSFDTYGLGELNVTKGTVTRERNGNYTLYAEIPVNDPAVAILEKEMKLKADAGLRTKNQTFEISRIVKDSSSIVKIYGQHISHKLEYMALRNATVFNGSAYSALAIWKGALIGDLRFDVWSDIQTVGKGVFDISKMENARQALGGVEGSILDIYGGEYEFDNMTIRLHKQLGRTAPTVLEYGRNILSAESDETIESTYTSVLPFATYTPDKPEGDTSDSQPDPVTVTLPENYVDSKYKALYAHRRIKVVDFSSEFKSDSKSKDIPTADKLRKLTTDYMERNAIGKPKINTKIEYADLAKTLDYADNGWIEELELCDIVPIYYPQISLTDETAKVTTITYDFVHERHESVEFGDIGTNVRSTMQSGLAGKVDDIAKAQQDFENSLPDYLLNAQGNKVWYNHPDDKEHKIGDIWFEKNGIYDRMYVWNGEMWEKRIDTEDVDKIKKEVDKQLEEAKQSTAIEIAKADAKAQEALALAGTIPDVPTLSEQIKARVMNSEEFNHLTETNKLYERVIGESETDMPDKLSRLVIGSQIFQTEVGQYSKTGGPNLIRNSGYKDGLKYFSGTANRFRLGTHPFYYNGKKPIAIISNGSTNEVLYQTERFDLERNTDYVLNFRGFNNSALTSCEVFLLGRKKDETQNYTVIKHLLKPTKLSGRGVEDVSLTFNSGEIDNAYVRFDNNGSNGGQADLYIAEIDLYKGANKRPWQPAPEDSAEPIEAVRTQMTQLAGSWAVKNLKSDGDVLNSINVLADGTNRIDGRLTHITGQTKIDNAVIKDGMIANLNADKITGGTIDASQINVINVNAGNVLAGTLTGMTVRGGRIEGLNGKMYIDLQNSQYNVLNNEATIRRIDDTNSSQFIKLTKSGFIAERFRDSNAALMVLGTNHNKDPKEVERHDNETFAGIRLWSGKGNGTEESLTEFVGDRVLIYNNGRYRSPWNFHGNTNDGNAYLIPMNQNNVKHYIGRGDFFVEGIYSRHFYMSGGRDIGQYLWDLLTCFGIMKRYGQISGSAGGHVQGVLDKYGFK